MTDDGFDHSVRDGRWRFVIKVDGDHNCKNYCTSNNSLYSNSYIITHNNYWVFSKFRGREDWTPFHKNWTVIDRKILSLGNIQ